MNYMALEVYNSLVMSDSKRKQKRVDKRKSTVKRKRKVYSEPVQGGSRGILGFLMW